MLRRELSARLERHLERGEEEMRLTREEMRLNRKEMGLNRAAHARNQVSFEEMMGTMMAAFVRFEERLDEQTLFLHESSRRSEKLVQNLIRRNNEFFRDLNVKLDVKTEAMLAEMKEVREESRAQREALLALIDRLPPAQAA